MFDPVLKKIADTLVANCRAGEAYKGLDDYYAENAVSTEAADMGDGNVVIEGLAGIKGKHEWWNANFDVHQATVEGPFLHGDDRFGVIFELDATYKPTNERSQMKELAIYTVADGKIVREDFYAGV